MRFLTDQVLQGTEVEVTEWLHALVNKLQMKFYRVWNFCMYVWDRPPLWSSGQSIWLQNQRSRPQFLALPDFLRSSGSGMQSTQPRDYNWENDCVDSPVEHDIETPARYSIAGGWANMK
jgi:hypothetical protein